jgi:antitoxin HigA-1
MKNGMRPIHPGEILREEFLIAVLDLNNEEVIKDIAKEIGINFDDLQNLIEENQNITEEIAYLLGGYFDTSPEFWMNMQSSYDERKKNYQSEIYEKDNLLRGKIYECLVNNDICSDLNGHGPSPNNEKFTNEIEVIFKEAGIFVCHRTVIKAVRAMYSTYHCDDIDESSNKSRYFVIAECLVMLSKHG